jgi:HEAT repeats
MDFKKPSGTIWLALACLCLSVGGALPARAGGKAPAAAGQVVFHPSPSGPVTDRAAWARGEAKAERWDKGFWLGFGIRRLMGEHSTMGWYPWGGPGLHLTLDDLINGRKSPLEKKVANDQAARGTAASMPEAARAFAARRRGDEPERLVMKDVAIMVRMTAGDAEFPADIRVSNLDLPFDLEGLPFVWAGMATHAESLAYLVPLYAQAAGRHDKLSVLWAVGLHREPGAVVPFAGRILAGKEGEEIRAEAAECLGEQNDPKALDLLMRTIKSDPSQEVRERAVEGLVEMVLPAAGQALMSLALNGADRSVRSEAVRGLAELATAETIELLEKISAEDRDPEVRDEAIHAFADFPGRKGLAHLVNLARTHPEGAVRTEAVAAIGEVGGAEAVKALAELAGGRRR